MTTIITIVEKFAFIFDMEALIITYLPIILVATFAQAILDKISDRAFRKSWMFNSLMDKFDNLSGIITTTFYQIGRLGVLILPCFLVLSYVTGNYDNFIAKCAGTSWYAYTQNIMVLVLISNELCIRLDELEAKKNSGKKTVKMPKVEDIESYKEFKALKKQSS
jgi:hypothetical protein